MATKRTIGVTGHQARAGLDWEWTRSSVAHALRDDGPFDTALTSLAVGSDQLFAHEALRACVQLRAVIPFEGYERCFEGDGLRTYLELLARAGDVDVLRRDGTDEEAFLAAGIRIADSSDLLVAVWDGRAAEGLGGTADVVAHALGAGRAILHLDPFARTVRRL